MNAESGTLRDNIARVQERITTAATRAGRQPAEVKLVAASKTMSAERIAAAAALGLRCFGENRVQEAAEKIPPLNALGGDLEWHLLGTLQRNKIRAALEMFAILQSVDSPRLAEAISQRAGQRTVPILLEVYLGHDPARPGFRPDEVRQQLDALAALPGILIRGLMTVAPLGLDETGTRRVFADLRRLLDDLVAARPDLELTELSMGMTDDYELAIAEGATIVRIGRAIFGERPSQFSG